MTGCLRDRTLWLLHEGDGSASHQAHLLTCPRCTVRYQRLVQDLQVISDALGAVPPSPAVFHRSGALRYRTVALAAALAALVVFAGVEAWIWRMSVSWVRPQPKGSDADALPFLEEVSQILSPTGDPSGVTIVVLGPTPEFADLMGAPEATWLDDWDEGPLSGMR